MNVKIFKSVMNSSLQIFDENLFDILEMYE